MKHRLLTILMTGALALCSWQAGLANYMLGDKGDDVKMLQRKLTSAGCLVRADGNFDEKMVTAVKKFQKKNKLDVDGVIGPATYKALTGKKIPQAVVERARKKNAAKGGVKSGMGPAVHWTRPANLTKKQKALTDTAMKYVGVPYRFGGTTPKGFDCSGFMQFVFNKNGIILPRAADEQYGIGKKISVNSLQPGDLVFFTTYTSGVSHSGMYLGDGYFISSTSSRGVIVTTMKSGYWHDCYVGAKRVL